MLTARINYKILSAAIFSLTKIINDKNKQTRTKRDRQLLRHFFNVIIIISRGGGKYCATGTNLHRDPIQYAVKSNTQKTTRCLSVTNLCMYIIHHAIAGVTRSPDAFTSRSLWEISHMSAPFMYITPICIKTFVVQYNILFEIMYMADTCSSVARRYTIFGIWFSTYNNNM